MIDENMLNNDLLVNVHKEHFQDYQTGAKGTYYSQKDVFDCIDNQPKISVWIPCSERLPEEKINPVTKDFYEYQVTFKSEDVTDVRHYKFGNGHWWNGPGIMDEYVTAWREPLEAYHEQMD